MDKSVLLRKFELAEDNLLFGEEAPVVQEEIISWRDEHILWLDDDAHQETSSTKKVVNNTEHLRISYPFVYDFNLSLLKIINNKERVLTEVSEILESFVRPFGKHKGVLLVALEQKKKTTYISISKDLKEYRFCKEITQHLKENEIANFNFKTFLNKEGSCFKFKVVIELKSKVKLKDEYIKRSKQNTNYVQRNTDV